MIKYTLSQVNPHQQYIQFKGVFEHDASAFFALQLPAWRPGRYELGNFAKNIRKFKVQDENGKELRYKKVKKDLWHIEATGASSVNVFYEYYSQELNAGSTFLNEELLYVNPVNCFMYKPGNEEVDAVQINLEIPENYLLACSLPKITKHALVAKNIHELLDSPFMASAELKHYEFEESGCNFHFWINGNCPLDFQTLESDFRPFCRTQIRDFDGIPVDDYLFLFHFLEYKAYHGVEHEKCTVITLGPSEELTKRSFYEELLGVSSHELYHTWNVKAMRPLDMLPYDYSKENYSELGFVYEGVTTYMGDWYLLHSGVLSFEQYAKHFSSYLMRHHHNQGRNHYSVAESSFDTWLDGYVSGAPGRKVSIYTEGCLIAMICDLLIIKHSQGEQNLASAMKILWTAFGAKGIGYQEDDYFQVLSQIADFDFSLIQENFVHGTTDIQNYLSSLLDEFGMQINFIKSKNDLISRYGLKSTAVNNTHKILDVAPNSPADTAGIHIGDTFTIENQEETKITIRLNHLGKSNIIDIMSDNGLFFPTILLTQKSELSELEINNFKNWAKRD